MKALVALARSHGNRKHSQNTGTDSAISFFIRVNRSDEVMRPWLLLASLFAAVSTLASSVRAETTFYLTDLEGDGARWNEFIKETQIFERVGETLCLKPGFTFVYGGDTVDRGDTGMRIVDDLVALKKCNPDRVHLIIGNRDLNKLSLARFLDSKTLSPEDIDKVVQFFQGINAANAIEHRTNELRIQNQPHEQKDAVQSLIRDLGQNGRMREYLELGVLSVILGDTVFVHGAINDENAFVLPDQDQVFEGRIRDWLSQLNRWKTRSLEAYLGAPQSDAKKFIGYAGWSRGVIYGRYSNDNVRGFSSDISRRFAEEGFRRIVVGHTPNGESPSFRRFDGIDVVMADNSYAPSAGPSIVQITADEVETKTRVDGGHVVRASLKRGDLASLIGQKTEDEYFIKGQLEDGKYVLFKVGSGFKPITQYSDLLSTSSLFKKLCSRLLKSGE